jgi:phosphinothricin acetyltransferase
MTECTIRAATTGDASAIAEIYAHYVRTSTATFELDPPSAVEIGRRMTAIFDLGLPYLVAEHEDRILGYAYAAQFRPRPAYRFAVENSVYVEADHLRQGIGRLLLKPLIEQCNKAGARQMIAGISGDNPASIALHATLGFAPVGVLRGVGFKFEKWLDVTLMQRALRIEPR